MTLGPARIVNQGTVGVDTATNASSQPISGATVNQVYVEGSQYGMKIGQGAVASDLNVSNFITRNTRQSIYASQLQDSTFTNLDLQTVTSTNLDHCIYLSDRVYRVSFDGLNLRNEGQGWCIHMYNGYYYAGQSTWGSDTITFSNCTLDARGGAKPLIISGGFKNIVLRNVTFLMDDGSAYAPIEVSSCSSVTVDGFEAWGGAQLVQNDGDVSNVQIKNGVYHSTSPLGGGSGVTFTNVTRGSTTPPSTTSTTRATTTTTSRSTTTTTRSTTTTTVPPTTTTRQTTTTTYRTTTTAPSTTTTTAQATTRPSAVITAPANGASVSGTVSVGVYATAPKYVDHVDYYVDGVLRARWRAASGQYVTRTTVTWNWNTWWYRAGTHTLRVDVVDKAGQTASTSIWVRKG